MEGSLRKEKDSTQGRVAWNLYEHWAKEMPLLQVHSNGLREIYLEMTWK